jgi:hypothetical protein
MKTDSVDAEMLPSVEVLKVNDEIFPVVAQQCLHADPIYECDDCGRTFVLWNGDLKEMVEVQDVDCAVEAWQLDLPIGEYQYWFPDVGESHCACRDDDDCDEAELQKIADALVVSDELLEHSLSIKFVIN